MRLESLHISPSLCLSMLLGLSGCASFGTQPLTVPINQISDLQLISDIQSDDARLAQLGVSLQYLAMTRPAPTYTLTGSSFYSGSFWSYGNFGNFNFQGQSIYRLTPDYSAQIGNAIAGAIVSGQISNTLHHRAALLNEAMARIARRQAESHTTVENFYQVHADLKGQEALVACIAPWVQAENPGLSEAELLNATASRSRGLIRQDPKDLTGDWYGLIVEEISYADGTKMPFWSFAKAHFVQSGNGVLGSGSLVDGEQFALQAQVEGDSLSGSVMNTTYNLGFAITGKTSTRQLVVDFRSESGGNTFVGRAVMVR